MLRVGSWLEGEKIFVTQRKTRKRMGNEERIERQSELLMEMIRYR